MRIRRPKRCYFIVLAAVATFFSMLYMTGYSVVLWGMDPSVTRPRNYFEDVAHGIDPKRPRIMVSWYGRSGNHMFQYSALIGIAKMNNMTPIIPPNVDLLDIFNLPTLQGAKSLLRNPIIYKDPPGYVGIYDKTNEHLDQTRDAFLDGYHQAWKYYEPVREELLTKHFIFHQPIKNKAESYIKDARDTKGKLDAVTIGVHVRRGDFVRQRIKGFTAAPIPYYYKTMNYFRRKYGNVLFIMITNDYYWAIDNLDIGPDVYYSTNTDPAVDLASLVSCDHVIITSGSFSWWAGFLSRGEVIYYHLYPEPNTKIGRQYVLTDYYPPHWKAM